MKTFEGAPASNDEIVDFDQELLKDPFEKFEDIPTQDALAAVALKELNLLPEVVDMNATIDYAEDMIDNHEVVGERFEDIKEASEWLRAFVDNLPLNADYPEGMWNGNKESWVKLVEQPISAEASDEGRWLYEHGIKVVEEKGRGIGADEDKKTKIVTLPDGIGGRYYIESSLDMHQTRTSEGKLVYSDTLGVRYVANEGLESETFDDTERVYDPGYDKTLDKKDPKYKKKMKKELSDDKNLRVRMSSGSRDDKGVMQRTHHEYAALDSLRIPTWRGENKNIREKAEAKMVDMINNAKAHLEQQFAAMGEDLYGI